MRFLTYQYTNPGARDPNEDSMGSFSGEKYHAWIAADGLGGHSHGEAASREAVQKLSDAMSKCRGLDEGFIQDTFAGMNDAVTSLHGPLTTVVAAFSDGEKLWYGNDGDSRLLFIRRKEVIGRTNDHSLAFLAYKTGQIEYDEIPLHPAQNRLFHSLGFENEFVGEFYSPIDLEPGDAFILCTDGFWELVNERETIRTLNISQTPQEWLEFMLEILESRLKPTSDNYTAVCVLVRED